MVGRGERRRPREVDAAFVVWTSATPRSTAKTSSTASVGALVRSPGSTRRTPSAVGGKHSHRIPGEGDLDVGTIFDALDGIGYDGFAALELYASDEPDRAARKADEALETYI
nr:hypothetical protein [Natronococcus sp. CG52]